MGWLCALAGIAVVANAQAVGTHRGVVAELAWVILVVMAVILFVLAVHNFRRAENARRRSG